MLKHSFRWYDKYVHIQATPFRTHTTTQILQFILCGNLADKGLHTVNYQTTKICINPLRPYEVRLFAF